MRSNTITRVLVLFFGLGLLLSTAAPVLAEKPIEINNYWPLGKAALQHKALTRFMDGVEKASNGRIKFNRFCCKTMGSPTASIESVRGGSLDITTVGVGGFGKLEPAVYNMMMPYLFKDYDHLNRVVSSDLWMELTKGLEKFNLKPITNFNAGFRDLLTVDKPVHKVADLKGMKLKVALVDPFRVTWDLLGTVSVPMPASEQYMAMKTGVIKGVEMPPTNMLTTKVCEVAKYYSPVRVAWLGPMTVMNLKRWNSLSADLQAIMLSEARKAAKWSFEEGAAINAADLQTIKTKYGVKEQEVDIADFQRATEKAYDILSTEKWYNQSIIDRIRKM